MESPQSPHCGSPAYDSLMRQQAKLGLPPSRAHELVLRFLDQESGHGGNARIAIKNWVKANPELCAEEDTLGRVLSQHVLPPANQTAMNGGPEEAASRFMSRESCAPAAEKLHSSSDSTAETLGRAISEGSIASIICAASVEERYGATETWKQLGKGIQGTVAAAATGRFDNLFPQVPSTKSPPLTNLMRAGLQRRFGARRSRPQSGRRWCASSQR